MLLQYEMELATFVNCIPMSKSLRYYLLPVLLLLFSFSGLAQSPIAKAGDKELLKIYPNPVVSEANISITRDVDLDNSRVSITFFNIVGKEVFTIANVKDYSIRITRETFLPGLYIFQLKVDEKVMSTGRISFK
jgi:hypothetical protein